MLFFVDLVLMKSWKIVTFKENSSLRLGFLTQIHALRVEGGLYRKNLISYEPLVASN